MKGKFLWIKKIVFVLFLFNSLFLFGIDYSNIKPLSDFRIMGTIELRKEIGLDAESIVEKVIANRR